MILLCGIPSETPLAMVAGALDELGLDYRVFNQRRALETRMAFAVDDGRVGGELELEGERIDLADISGVYLRLMDDQSLPELEGQPDKSQTRRHVRALHDAFYRWSEIAPSVVINRAEPQGSNSSKTYQAQLITRFGFKTPETLVTNDPAAARAFYEQHGRVIFKSISGVRSIVRDMNDDDLGRLDAIRWCPVQFQAFVPGVNVRVHVVGGEVFATRIDSDITDYRYASRLGGEATLSAVDLPDATAARCLALARGLGLEFVGIDLKITPQGEAYCFEVNPCPAYSYFEANTGQPIARAVARRLAG
jgi:glutathione synthase/RimK-type ligase-like ATP-grasp enzyme